MKVLSSHAASMIDTVAVKKKHEVIKSLHNPTIVVNDSMIGIKIDELISVTDKILDTIKADGSPGITMESISRAGERVAYVVSDKSEHQDPYDVGMNAPVPFIGHGQVSSDWPVKNVVPGVIGLIGRTFAGKTYRLEHELKIGVIIRYSEPLEQIDFSGLTVHAESLKHALGMSAVLSVLGITHAIDSLRRQVYQLKGSAVSGGMIGSLFTMVTDVNNMLSTFGGTAIVAINPLLDEEQDELKKDKFATFFSRLASSCAGAQWVEAHALRDEAYRLLDGRIDTTFSGGSGLVKDPGGKYLGHDPGLKPLAGPKELSHALDKDLKGPKTADKITDGYREADHDYPAPKAKTELRSFDL